MFEFGTGWFLEVAVCSSCMILIVLFLTSVMGRWSAAIRHRVWFLTFCGLAFLPVAILFLPSWNVPVLPVQIQVAEENSSDSSSPDAVDDSAVEKSTPPRLPGFELENGGQLEAHDQGLSLIHI